MSSLHYLEVEAIVLRFDQYVKVNGQHIVENIYHDDQKKYRIKSFELRVNQVGLKEIIDIQMLLSLGLLLFRGVKQNQDTEKVITFMYVNTTGYEQNLLSHNHRNKDHTLH